MTSERTDARIFLNSLVPLGASVEEALRHMEAEAALIIDADGRLVGLLTDGDIRRALLAGAELRSPVSSAMTKNPLTIVDGLPKEEIVGFMLERRIRHLPVVDDERRPIGLELLKNQYDPSAIAQAVLMAGGKGMRLRPLTEDTPKPLLKVAGKTILDNVLDGLKASGIGEVVISVNYLGGKIKEHVAASPCDGLDIDFVEESKALGTAGALSLLEPRPKAPFIVMNADLITQIDFKSLQRFHAKEGNQISVCVRKIKETVPYGVISLAQDARSIAAVEEKPEREYFVNAGIYMLNPELIDLIPKNQFFDMTSLIKAAMDKGLKAGAFPVYEYWRDIGRHQEMQAAAADLANKQDTASIREGATP
jgi:dTDP-glucose pyrophosphorylase